MTAPLFLSRTLSVCPVCLQVVEANLISKDNAVYLT